jgi:hypothetical protein
VLNPLVYRNSVGQNGYSNGNLTLSGLGAAVAYFNMATMGISPSSGKFYWECQIGTASSGSYTGVTQDSNFQSGNWDAWYDSAGGVLYKGGTSVASVATATTNDVIGIAYDSTANTCAFYKNNTLLGTVTGLTSATMFSLQCTVVSAVLNLNFGQRPFSYTPPSGFKTLCTTNLPTSTIQQGNLFFNALTYAGSASNQTISGLSFQPDFIWFKERTTAGIDHNLFDSARSNYGSRLISNATNAEAASGAIISVSSTGYSLLGGVSNTNDSSGRTYVTWNWKAGGTAVTNTNGTINSQVSANTTSGFSVVTWVHSSTTSTIGHGLGVAPQFVIVKSRTTAYNWDVGCNSIGWGNRLNLNTTAAAYSPAFWNSTAPTSTVFTYAGSGATNGDNMVAYCFTPIAGYSAFGSYTGNGSTDGTFVYLGFRPAFLMVKRSNAAVNWYMFDSKRNTYNAVNLQLSPNLSNAESSDFAIDFLSNGFKLRIADSFVNGSGDPNIYMAFAEYPFKSALAR